MSTKAKIDKQAFFKLILFLVSKKKFNKNAKNNKNGIKSKNWDRVKTKNPEAIPKNIKEDSLFSFTAIKKK